MQVSRLGNPLINEVVIPLGQKDFWNRCGARGRLAVRGALHDARGRAPRERALRSASVRSPGRRPQQVDETGRADLDAILLTGVPGLNFTGPTQSDLLRLNTALKPGVNGACPGGTASPAAPDRLAVLDADLCGFPNGRRLDDDVVDIELRAIAQGYGTFLNSELRAPEQEPEQPRRRRRGRERRRRSRTRSRTSPHRTRATRCRKATSPQEGGRGPAGAPPAPATKRGAARETDETDSRSGGGGSDRRPRSSSAASSARAPRPAGASAPAAAPVTATEQLQSGFAAGAQRHGAIVAKLQATLRAIPDDVSALGAARARLPAAGARDRRPDLLHEVGAGSRPGAPPRPARPRRDERARLARALPPPLRRGARPRPQGARASRRPPPSPTASSATRSSSSAATTRPSRRSTRWRR